jgi:hypothetical protein
MKRVRLFYTYSGSKIARLAVWATGGPWGHVGIAFEHDDGTIELFEARSSEGFVGPFTLNEAQAYIKERGGRFLLGSPIEEIGRSEAEAIHEKTLAMVGNVSYSKLQLGAMFLAERYGIRPRRSPLKIVCSEAVARNVYPYMDLRDCNHDTFDMVSPNSTYWRMCEIQAGYDEGGVRDDETIR